jgi:hypothetical protein
LYSRSTQPPTLLAAFAKRFDTPPGCAIKQGLDHREINAEQELWVHQHFFERSRLTNWFSHRQDASLKPCNFLNTLPQWNPVIGP